MLGGEEYLDRYRQLKTEKAIELREELTDKIIVRPLQSIVDGSVSCCLDVTLLERLERKQGGRVRVLRAVWV